MLFALIVSIAGLMSFVGFLLVFNSNPFLIRRVVKKHVIPDIDKAMREHGDLAVRQEERRDDSPASFGTSYAENVGDDAMDEEISVAEDSFAALRDLYGDSENSDSGR